MYTLMDFCQCCIGQQIWWKGIIKLLFDWLINSDTLDFRTFYVNASFSNIQYRIRCRNVLDIQDVSEKANRFSIRIL